jgi:hypothetical protein
MIRNVEKLKPGELYKIISSDGLETYPMPAGPVISSDINSWATWSELTVQSVDTIFMFLETVVINKSTYSKILVDDKIYITFNFYHKLNPRYVEKI